MKKTLLTMGLALLMFFAATLTAIAQEATSGPKITFDPPSHNYGTVYVDDLPDTNLDISFTNTGDIPLTLTNVRACCGTRVLSWPKEPVAPGKEGMITVQFRIAPRAQRISRTVTLTYSDPDPKNVIYRITGEVVER
jgi:hypothetical protein